MLGRIGSFNEFILGADIGGTNSFIGLFGIRKKMPILLVWYNFKSQELDELDDAVIEVLNDIKKYYNLKIKNACLGVAGVVSEDKQFAKITNVRWDVNARRIKRKTGIKIQLINDFEAIGYSINSIKQNQIKIINKAKKISKASIVVIGAGTGLGKSTLVFDEKSRLYSPLPSEAGHIDFCPKDVFELELANFIKRINKIKGQLPFEYVLSGHGISDIYRFVSNKKKNELYIEIQKTNFAPELISQYRKKDKFCKKTFDLFKTFYARFARNVALESLPFGGLYIAGGIAPKNIDIFDKEFVKEFEQSHRHSHVLKRIPVYIVKDLNIGLIGSAIAGMKK